MQADFVAKLDLLREACGFPLIVSSGYRSPAYNAKVSSTGRAGPHTTGRAVDLKVKGLQAWQVIYHAQRLGFTGIGVKQHGGHGTRFIHLDDLPRTKSRPRPWIWSYA